jgi:hypothetical protein
MAGAEHEARWVWAPNQVAVADFHTNQQVPLAARAARVMLPVGPFPNAPPPPPVGPFPNAPPPPPVTATLTTMDSRSVR